MTNLTNEFRNFDRLFDVFNRRNIGYDWLPTVFEDLAHNVPSVGFPPYDIEKDNDDKYTLKVALAGYKPDDVDVTLDNNVLTVSSGSQKEQESGVPNFIYKGIAKRSFNISYKLGEHMEVQDAKFDNGLLMIDIVRNIPEEKKPRRIAIQGQIEKPALEAVKDEVA